MKDKVKYGRELLDIEIPEGTDLSILLPKQHPTGVRSEEEIVEDALAHPIGAGLLAEEIHAGDTVCILTNDITRLTRSHIYIPILVRELNKAGVPDGDITILFANGMHSAMTEEQMIDSYKKLAAKGAKNFGIHAFLASNTISDEYYPELAGILFQLAVRVQKATGVHIGYINLSGGVGIPYRPEQTENDIMAIGEGVRKKFEEILVPAGMGDVAIFTEMGRFTTGPYGALVATAIHEKHIYKEYIGLDACAANLMRPAMYGAYHHITVLGKENEPCDHMYDVVGGLCENNDKFAIDRMLPKIDIGDIVYIHDTGAHGSAMGYNYNGKLRSAEVLLCEDGTHRLIRRAETPRDYFATLDFLPLMKPLFED